MPRILTIVGARPQFVKAAMVSRAIAEHNRSGTGPQIVEDIVHTGQHYDRNMSDVFFTELGIPEPVVNLGVGSGSHGDTTGRMLAGIEKEILSRQPDWVLVYGDTNSTLAGALAAAKLHVPVAHVEAGLRSFNRRMPEEINRVLTDHVSTLLLCPTHAAVANLAREGITQGVHHVGDVMYDAALLFGEVAERLSTVLQRLGLSSKPYYLATVHRAENTDDAGRLRDILTAFLAIGSVDCPVVFPVHPRTRARLAALGLPALVIPAPSPALSAPGPLDAERSTTNEAPSTTLLLIDPVPYLDMVMLEKHAKVILTDSGGVQKEAYFHRVPCVTLREGTEWGETVEAGWNQVVGVDAGAIRAAAASASRGTDIPDYGTGFAAATIVNTLVTPIAASRTGDPDQR